MTSREVGDPNLPGGEQFASPAPASLPTHALTSDVSNRPAGGGRRGVLLGVGVVIAILLAAAALVVAVTGVGGQPVAPPTNDASRSSTPTSQGDTAGADRDLCNDVAPLLRESADDGKSFVNLGENGTPERDAGIAHYRATVEDWVSRIQPVLDAHANPPRYLTRMLQQLVDFTRSYAENIRPGPATDFDVAAWNNRVVAYGGPFQVCHKLGVNW